MIRLNRKTTGIFSINHNNQTALHLNFIKYIDNIKLIDKFVIILLLIFSYIIINFFTMPIVLVIKHVNYCQRLFIILCDIIFEEKFNGNHLIIVYLKCRFLLCFI